MKALWVLLAATLLTFGTGLLPSAEAHLKLGAQLGFSSYKEQVKNTSGAATGALFSATHFGLLLNGMREVNDVFDLGIYTLLEKGQRSLAPFGGLNAAGSPVAGAGFGGSFTHLFVGPMARARWNFWFVDVAYAGLGWKWDSLYPGLTSASGNRSSTFRPDLLKAWLFGLGATIPLAENLDGVIRLEYRFLYFDDRGGDLSSNLLLGGQTIRPNLGVQWRI